MGIRDFFTNGVEALHNTLLSDGYLHKAAKRYQAAERGADYAEYGTEENAFDPSSDEGHAKVEAAARSLIICCENYDKGHDPSIESASDILRRDYGINLEDVVAEFDTDYEADAEADQDYDGAAPA